MDLKQSTSDQRLKDRIFEFVGSDAEAEKNKEEHEDIGLSHLADPGGVRGRHVPDEYF